MNAFFTKKNIEKHIALGETYRAIQILLSYAEYISNESLKAQALLISSQYHDYKRNLRLGLEVDAKTLPRLNQAILEICTDIFRDAKPDSPQTEASLPQDESDSWRENIIWQRYKKYTPLSIAVVFVVILGVFTWQSNRPKKSIEPEMKLPSVTVEQVAAFEKENKKAREAATKKAASKPSAPTSKTPTVPVVNKSSGAKEGNKNKKYVEKGNILEKIAAEISDEEYETALVLADSVLRKATVKRDSLFFLRAVAKINLHRYADACLDLNLTLKLNDAFVDAYFRKSEALLKMNDRSRLAEARAYAQKGLKLKPNDEFGLEQKKMIDRRIAEE